MKIIKSLPVYFLCCLFPSMHPVTAQNYIEIGTGTLSNTMPVYSYWNYSWSSLIYNHADLGTAKAITKIGLNCINGPKTITNQKIYFKLTTNAVYTAANYEDPLNTGYTLAFQGDLTFVTGWNEITLTTPIPYDGVQNLSLHWENRWGTSYGPAFYSTTSTINNNKNCGNDISFPPPSQTGYLNPYPSSLSNMRFYYASTGPATPSNPIPADNATNVSVSTTLSWLLGANTTNYDLYFGTNSLNLPLVVNNAPANAGMNTFTPTGLLSDSTMHYWKVVAKNGSQQEVSPVWKFKTEVVIDQFPYFEGFEDSLVFNTYPVTSAWVISPDVSWYQYPTNQHSGLLCAKTSWYNSGNQAILRSPKVLLPSNLSISYYWRNTNVNKVSGHDTTYFEVTADGGQSWIKLDTLAPASVNASYVQRTHGLTPYAGNNFYFRFRHVTDNTGSASNVYLDDISISGTVQIPNIQLSPGQLAFSELYVNGHTFKKLVVTNSGPANLVINSISLPSPFSGSYSGTLLPGHSDTISVQFTATTAGSFSGNLVLNVQGGFSGSNTVNLSGTVLDDLAVIDEPFDAVAQIPAHWNIIRSLTDPNNNVAVVSGAEAYSAPNAVKINNAADLTSPLIFITPGVNSFSDHELSFYAKKASNSDNSNLIIGLMDDPYNASGFVQVQSIALTTVYTKYTLTFSSSNNKPYLAFRHGDNTAQSAFWLDNVLWNNPAPPPAPPLPALGVYPPNNAQNVDIMMAARYLIWASGGGSPGGYKLSMGTNNPPSNLINNANLGDTVVYQIPTVMSYNTTYFWQITPYNTVGQALNCPVWSFTTMADPAISQFPHLQNFDALTPGSAFFYPPFLMGYTYPLGWSVVSTGNLPLSWNVTGSSAHSAPNAMNAGPSNFSSLDEWLFTPPFTLTSGLHYKVDFFYKKSDTGSPTVEKLELRAGNSNTPTSMTTQVYDNQNITNTIYQQGSGIFTASSSGNYFFAFHGTSASQQGQLFLDDIAITEINTTGEEELRSNSGLEIFPNPSHGFLQVSFTGQSFERSVAEIWSMNGRLLMSLPMDLPVIQLDMNSFDKGSYILRLISDQKVSYRKIIID